LNEGIDKSSFSWYNTSVKRIREVNKMKKFLEKEIVLDNENNDYIITVGQVIAIAICLVGIGICVGLII
jgi:hypothetical protein